MTGEGKTKICTRCKIEKPIAEFHKHKRSKDGLRSQCKECRKPCCRAYHAKNREKLNAYGRKYRIEHRDELNAKQRDYCASHKEERNAYGREYRAKNKEEVNTKKREYYDGHKIEQAAYCKARAEQYPERRKAINALNYAIISGKIIRPDICSNPFCNCTEGIQGHHWSYEEEHRLDPIWCCCSCHQRIHSTGQGETKNIDWSVI